MGGRGEDGSGGAGAGVGEGEGEALVFGVDSSGGAEPAATALPRRALGLRNPGIWGRGWARGSQPRVLEAPRGGGGFTIQEFIDGMGWGGFNTQVLFQCGACWGADALEMMLVSFLGPALDHFMASRSPRYRSLVRGLLGGLTFAGVAIGCWVWGFMADRFGRRRSYFASTLIISVCGLLSAFARSPEVLLFLRFCVGFGLGGAPAAFTLFSEFTPQKHRGWSLIFAQGVFWSVGALIEASLAWIILSRPDPSAWRLFVALSAVPSVLLLGMFPWLPESPRYLLVSGRKEELLRTCRRAARVNRVELPDGFHIEVGGPGRPTVSVEEEDEDPGQQALAEEGVSLPAAAAARKGKTARVQDLLVPSLRRTTVLLWTLWFSLVFSYYGLAFVTPAYFSSREGNEYLAAFIVTFAEFPGLLASTLMVEPLGRKSTQTVLLLVCVSGSFVLCFSGLPYGVLVLAAVVARGSVNGAFAATYVYTPEVYPTVVRALALGTCSGIGRIAGILTSFVASSAEDLGSAFALGVFTFFALLAAGACHLLPVETKGRALDDHVKEHSAGGDEASRTHV